MEREADVVELRIILDEFGCVMHAGAPLGPRLGTDDDAHACDWRDRGVAI
jgi:hypothetical protein